MNFERSCSHDYPGGGDESQGVQKRAKGKEDSDV
jgi:hypothetical protein